MNRVPSVPVYGVPFAIQPSICIDGSVMDYHPEGCDWSAARSIHLKALAETRREARFQSMLKFARREPFYGKGPFAAAVQGMWLLLDAADEEVKRLHNDSHRGTGLSH